MSGYSYVSTRLLKRRLIACLIAIGLLITCGLGYSQTKDPKPDEPPEKISDISSLSLRQAIELAETVNLDVLFSEERIREAAGLRKTARSEMLPEINGVFSATRQERSSAAYGMTDELPFKVPESIGPYNFFDTTAEGKIDLFNITNIQNWRAAKAEHKLTEEELTVAREESRMLVAALYFNALRNKEALKAAEADVGRSERLLGLEQDRKNTGAGIALDVMRAEVRLSSAREQLEHVKMEVTRSLLELTKALGVNFTKTLELTETLLFLPVDKMNIEDALGLAFKQRPDLVAQKQREIVAMRKKSAALAGLMPVAEAFADYGTNGTEIDDSTEDWLIGARVTLPIWDSFERGGRIEASRSVLAQVKNRTAELKRGIETEIRIFSEELESRQRQLEVAQETKKLSEQELKLAEDRYEAGVGTNIEVINAQTNMAESEFRVIENLYMYNLIRINWHKALGKARGIIE